ncbi:MAG: sulfotransferase [Anaerolineaceae bacterium]|nr:MAG: sulfotransferase [Anaerolineaceae bacterium]
MISLTNAGTFICGHPKSGTSLLMALLDFHPQVIVYPEETGFFRWFAHQTEGLSVEEKIRRAEELILHIFHWDPENPHPSQAGFADRDYTDISFDQVRTAYHRKIDEFGRSIPNILPAAIFAYGEVTGQSSLRTLRWVEKTPYNELFADKVFDLWSEARCIQTIRDPRDNYASYRRKHPEWTPEIFAFSWRASTHRGWSNRKQYGESRYLVIRYEDLVNDLETTLKTVRDFLGIEDHPTLREPSRKGISWGGNSMFGECFRGVSANPIGRYRTALDRDSIQRLEAALYPEMRRLDYPLDESISLRARMQWFDFRLRRAIGGSARGFLSVD